METAAIRQDAEAVRLYKLGSLADPLGHQVRRLHGIILHVDHAYADLKLARKLLEQIEIFPATAREFQRKLMNLRVEDRRKEIAVVAGPGGFAVAIAVADVQRNPGINTIHKGIQYSDAPGKIFGEPGVI